MIQTDIYVHSSRDSMYEKGEKLGLTGEALKLFSYVGCEVKLTINVDEKTGDAVIVAVDGRKLER
jgi:hypothetical protein